MKLNDLTIADIQDAAESNASEYDGIYQNTAKAAFIEGACWSHKHLLEKKDNAMPWCENRVDSRSVVITPEFLNKNGWKSNEEKNHFAISAEVNGISIYFEYNGVNKAFFYLDSIIPYPVVYVSQMKALFDVVGVRRNWED